MADFQYSLQAQHDLEYEPLNSHFCKKMYLLLESTIISTLEILTFGTPYPTTLSLTTSAHYYYFFNVGPPREDFFSGHLLSPIFQSSIFTFIHAAYPTHIHTHIHTWVTMYISMNAGMQGSRLWIRLCLYILDLLHTHTHRAVTLYASMLHRFWIFLDMPCYFQRPHHTYTRSLTHIYLWQKRFNSYDILEIATSRNWPQMAPRTSRI